MVNVRGRFLNSHHSRPLLRYIQLRKVGYTIDMKHGKYLHIPSISVLHKRVKGGLRNAFVWTTRYQEINSGNERKSGHKKCPDRVKLKKWRSGMVCRERP